jgi:DNA modification methylase
VWTIGVASNRGASGHYALQPEEIARLCVLASCPPGGTVLDPFLGAGTTAIVARRLGRACIGIELVPETAELARVRIAADSPLLAQV